jgi:hypothetical protein
VKLPPTETAGDEKQLLQQQTNELDATLLDNLNKASSGSPAKPYNRARTFQPESWQAPGAGSKKT